MKLLIFPILLLNFIALNIQAKGPVASIVDISKLKELDTDWSLLSELEINELNELEQKNGRLGNIDLLVKAKQLIISGDVDSAEFYLRNISDQNKKLQYIKNRYLGLIFFIKEDYQKSKEYLSSTVFNENQYYKRVCVTKIINEMSLNNMKELYYEIDNCLKTTSQYSKNDHFWLNNFYNLKFNREETFKGSTLSDSLYVLQNKEFTRIWLKSGIYLNKEYLILKLIKSLPESYYRSKRIRELVGLLYFRTGDKKQAMSFIEDIETANSENMKGNFYLQQKKYELAFGHYQLALKKKKNSLNALERSLPLVWLLSQWEEGHKLLDRLIKNDLPERKKLSLNSIFKLKQKRYTETQKQMDILSIMFKDELPIELEQMMVYLGLKNHNPAQYIKYSGETCYAMDGIGCWIQMQSIAWENIGKTIDRDEEIHRSVPETIENLKRTPFIKPIDELPTIDQQDIEELDSSLVRISPGG